MKKFRPTPYRSFPTSEQELTDSSHIFLQSQDYGAWDCDVPPCGKNHHKHRKYSKDFRKSCKFLLDLEEDK